MGKNPRQFVISLYENARAILEIFGFRKKEIYPPLVYASLVDLKYYLKFYYYGILGLVKNATPDQVKNKYLELALRYHPDKASQGEETKAALKFKEVNEAYQMLSNPKSNRIFINFTARFEEAKYSRHSIERGDALVMLSEYNYFMKVMLSHYDKLDLLFRYCLTLLKTKPLYI